VLTPCAMRTFLILVSTLGPFQLMTYIYGECSVEKVPRRNFSCPVYLMWSTESGEVEVLPLSPDIVTVEVCRYQRW
jgi:hypothetical protein